MEEDLRKRIMDEGLYAELDEEPKIGNGEILVVESIFHSCSEMEGDDSLLQSVVCSSSRRQSSLSESESVVRAFK